MQLSDYDASGRRGVSETGETVWIPADTVIAAVGEKVPTHWYEEQGLQVSEKGKLYVDEKTLADQSLGRCVCGRRRVERTGNGCGEL